MSLLTGCCVYRSRIVFTMGVTGWFSAKARTGPGMVAVATKAELMNGREMIGEENAPAPSTVLADRPAMTASHVNASVNRPRIPAMASHASTPAPERKPTSRAEGTTHDTDTRQAAPEAPTSAPP